MRSIRPHAELTFERKLEQILRVPFRQPDQRIGDDRFIQRVGHRGDTGLDDANGKALGNAVDLLPESRLKPLAGKPDLDEWPLANRQIWLEIQRPQVIAKVGQTHITSLWEAKKGNGPPDRDVFRHGLDSVEADKRDAMLVRLLRGGQRDKRTRISYGISSDCLSFMEVTERDVTRFRGEYIMRHSVLTADQDSTLGALRLDASRNVEMPCSDKGQTIHLQPQRLS